MDRGLNEAFAPTREQQQQQTKSQKQQQQQQQKNTINLKAINKENNKPTSRFFLSRQDYRPSAIYRPNTGHSLHGTVLNLKPFTVCKNKSCEYNWKWRVTSLLQWYTDTWLRINVYATNGTSIGKAIRRWQENERVVIIMGKDLHVCSRPYFIVTLNGGGTLKRTKKNDSCKFYVGLNLIPFASVV